MEQTMKGSRAARAARIALSVMLVLGLLQLGTFKAEDAYAGTGADSISDKSWNEVKGSIEGYMGVPYVWGGKSPSGWDCSGFVGWIAEYVYGVPGGAGYYTGSFVSEWSRYTVFTGYSAEDYNNAFAAGTVKPGDVILFFNSSGTDVHCAIAGEGQTIYHAWSEYFGTLNSRFDYMWGIDGGHGKTYASFAVYRGLAQAGWLELQKASSLPAITDGNPCYTLEGAVYGIYADAACTSLVTTVTTNASGYAKSGELEPGTYYVREITPPKGYALDKAAYPTTVSAGATAKVNGGTVSDVPQSDPTQFWVGKVDLETTLALPQGSASLAGAEFTVKYYASHYSTTDRGWIAATAPTRTWVVKTDAEGRSRLEDRYKVRGDAFYYYKGNVTIPLGTVTVQETRAPEGYLLDADTLFVQQVTSAGFLDTVEAYNAPVVKEQPMRGDHRLTKSVATSNDPEDQDLTRILVEGIRFEYYNDNDATVMSPAGKAVEKGGLVLTTVTDENGDASTKDVAKPKGWTGALAYGTYRVHEVIPQKVADRYKAEHGITLVAVDDWKVTIGKDGQYDPAQLVTNRTPQTPLRIVKLDATTGKTIPLDCSFQIFDGEGNLVTYADRYGGQSIDTWRTGNDGELTLPFKLDEGTYRVVELEAPYGYLLNAEGVGFAVDEYRTWDDPYTVEYADMPIMAEIEVVKADASSGGAVAGAEYTLRAAADIATGDGTVYFQANDIVASGLLTDEGGRIRIEGLHLGTYKLYETKAPQGYALDTTEHLIDVISQGQDVPVVKIRKDTKNVPTTLKIVKTDEFTGLPLAGAEFRIWQEGADGEESFDVEGIIGGLEANIIEADPAIISVTVNDPAKTIAALFAATEGDMIEFFTTGKAAGGAFMSYSIKAVFQKGHVIAIEKDGKPLFKTEPLIIKDPDLFDFTGNTGSDGILTLPYLLPGKYLAIETAAPEGYILPEDLEPTEFEVDGQGLIAGSSSIEVRQTNRRMEIGTTASDGTGGGKLVLNREKVTVVDAVAYSGARVGKAYDVEGILMDKATGEPLLTGGKEVTATGNFIAEDTEGTVEVVFTFDATGLATGTAIVVFEEMYEEGVLVAVHADINDEGQTVYIAEISIGTSAHGKGTDSKTIAADGKATIVDTMTYRNARVGIEYTVRGILMDQTANKPLTVNGKEVTAEAVFTPDAPDGSVDIEFAFDASALAGTAVTVFERLCEDGIVEPVATHEDIEDEGQTVRLVEPEQPEEPKQPGKGTPYDKTGRPFDGIALAVLGLLALCGTGAGVYAHRQRKKDVSEGSESDSE